MRRKLQSVNFIVVVEDNTALTGHAKVFIQHIARKDIRRDKMLDGVTIFLDGQIHLVLGGMLQENVQRNHSSLNVQMLEHDSVVHFCHHGRRELPDLVQEAGFKSGPRKIHI